MDSEGKPLKRPPNAYLLYSYAVRDQVRRENPDLTLVEMTKLISEQYKHERPEIIQRFKDEAARISKEFKEKYPDFQYKKKTTKKSKPKDLPDSDPVCLINQVFKDNPFTLQSLSH
jgi:transcription factor SOX7/8/10/18 (SOX group E/F)